MFSLTADGMTPHETAETLETGHGVLARAGVHCAPLAHRTFGTLTDENEGTERAGTVRVSVGAFTSDADVRDAARAVRSLSHVNT